MFRQPEQLFLQWASLAECKTGMRWHQPARKDWIWGQPPSLSVDCPLETTRLSPGFEPFSEETEQARRGRLDLSRQFGFGVALSTPAFGNSLFGQGPAARVTTAGGPRPFFGCASFVKACEHVCNQMRSSGRP